ncbi:hypothetical protein [Romboutsia ilealis]|nr:hypothetical protein [Romboutsia ilealis]
MALYIEIYIKGTSTIANTNQTPNVDSVQFLVKMNFYDYILPNLV